MSAPDPHPAVRDYGLVCVGSLTVMVLALVLRRPDGWALLPAVLGALGLAFRWRAAPLIVLLGLLVVLWSWWIGTDPGRLFLYALGWGGAWLLGWWSWHVPLVRTGPPSGNALPLADLLLAFSVLGYAAAQYRLQGLTVGLFPADARQPRRGRKGVIRDTESSCRSPERVTAREIVVILEALAACAGVASLLWLWLQRQTTELKIADTTWHGLVVLWLVGGSVLTVAGVLRYLAARRMTASESALYLQDVLWRETAREQRLVNRWLAWAWLRRRRREEKRQS
jgi:hypothetical protein